MNRITIERDAQTTTGQACLDLLRANFKTTGSRSTVADMVRHSGLAVYIGGRHVAVHEFGGADMGPRLAIITGDGPDWS